MDQDVGFHSGSRGASASDAVLRDDSVNPHLSAMLREEWRSLGRCRSGTAGPSAQATGCHVLAHPAIGVALVDIVPGAPPNAEARLRRALQTTGFRAGFPGVLPIWHGRISSGELPRLAPLLRQGFAALPPLSLPGGAEWVDGLWHALAQDPSWEASDGTPRIGTALVLMEEAPPPVPPPPPDRRRGPLLFLGFVASFWLGLAAGLVLISRTELQGRTPSASPPSAPSATAATVKPVATALAQPVPTAAPPPLPAGSVPPPEPASAQPGPAAAEAVPPAPAPPVSRAVPRAAAPAPPRPAIDRACSQALFRFQQGAALTMAEQVHLREGCATRR